MELAADRCYAALVARDARFDGRFFVGVVTTGVFCRPVCPAPTPKRQNVRVFACAAAAEAAGFRPCLRCRPECAPGTPAWDGTAATVARALRLMRDGAAAEGDVDHLADRLGIGARHLRRLFREHLGVGPYAVVRAERAHAARRLLDETDLPMTAVAATAGYRSVRQFNHAMRAVFAAAPTALRARRGTRRPSGATIRLRLAYRPPFDWDAILAHLALRATPGVERVTADGYARTIVHDGGAGVVRVRHRPALRAVEVEVPADAGRAIPGLAARARHLLDLDADPMQIAAHLATDGRLDALIARHGVPRLPGAWDPFELAVRAVIGQQVSVRAATTVAGRLAAALGAAVETDEPALDRLFPTPAALARLRPERASMPAARTRAVAALAAAVEAGTIVLDAGGPAEETTARLRALPGIGPWTASYVALRGLGDPDAFPASDLGLRKGWGNGDGLASVATLEAAAEPWRPWRGYAAMLLWKEGATT
jgi:AraC family transcriptional regulator of adaptative response / DNA-3-methyladenine glycosylase II